MARPNPQPIFIEGLMDGTAKTGDKVISVKNSIEEPSFVRVPPRSRTEVIPWDETIMLIAFTMSLRSKDPSTRVGAVITNSENRILATGYNGTPIGISDDQMIYNNDIEHLPFEQTKYAYVAHAEENALNNFIGLREQMRGGNLYTTLFPCNNCAKMIAANHIANVFFLEGPRSPDSSETKAAILNLETANIKAYQVVPSDRSIDLIVSQLCELKNAKNVIK